MRSVFSLLALLALASSVLVSKAIAAEPGYARGVAVVGCCGPVDKPIDPD